MVFVTTILDINHKLYSNHLDIKSLFQNLLLTVQPKLGIINLTLAQRPFWKM